MTNKIFCPFLLWANSLGIGIIYLSRCGLSYLNTEPRLWLLVPLLFRERQKKQILRPFWPLWLLSSDLPVIFISTWVRGGLLSLDDSSFGCLFSSWRASANRFGCLASLSERFRFSNGFLLSKREGLKWRFGSLPFTALLLDNRNVFFQPLPGTSPSTSIIWFCSRFDGYGQSLQAFTEVRWWYSQWTIARCLLPRPFHREEFAQDHR